MATRKIVLSDNIILRKVCKNVTEFDGALKQLFSDMKETMHKNDGAGLAAPQVGVLKRAVIVEADGKYYELVNPEIIYTAGNVNGVEGCLSIPGKYGYVARPKTVTVRAQNSDGEVFQLAASDMLARAVCHEIDHLNGVLFTDKMTKEAKK